MDVKSVRDSGVLALPIPFGRSLIYRLPIDIRIGERKTGGAAGMWVLTCDIGITYANLMKCGFFFVFLQIHNGYMFE